MPSDSPDTQPPAAPTPHGGGSLRTRAKNVLVGALAIGVLVWGGLWLHHRFTHLYIDDARVDGEVITISSRVSGWLTELSVIEGDEVKKGQVLARVDDRDSNLARQSLLAKLATLETQLGVVRAQGGQVDQETLGKVQAETNRLVSAEAEVASLEVQVKQAGEDFRRQEELYRQKWVSEAEMDRARTTWQQLQQNLRKAKADVSAAQGNLSSAGGSRRQTQVIERQAAVLMRQAEEVRNEVRRQENDIADRAIKAPADGRIVMTFVRKGEHVAPGQRILMFHDPAQIWVEANVKETDLARIAIGMKANVRVDAYPDRVFAGEVFRIGQAATSKFALLPDPNPSGNFTKITQRLPVRILLTDKNHALRPGMMVEVDIAYREQQQAR